MSDENANKQMNGSWVFMSEAPAITIRKRDPFGCDSTGLQQEHSFIDGGQVCRGNKAVCLKTFIITAQ